jgi:hypothetical protein
VVYRSSSPQSKPKNYAFMPWMQSRKISVSLSLSLSLSLLVAFPIALASKSFGQVNVVELRDTSAPQRVVLPAILPGGKSKVEVKVRNKTGRDLVLDEIRSSCGCMVVGDISKVFNAEQEIVLPVSLKTETRARKFGNSLTVVDSDQNEWTVSFAADVMTPVTCEKTEFHVDGTAEQVVMIPVVAGDGFEKFVGDLRHLRIEPYGEGIAKLKWEELAEDRGLLSATVRLPKERLVGSRFSAAIRFSSEDFVLDIPVVFSFEDKARVLLESVSRSRLRAGVQRVIVVGGPSAERAELKITADGVTFETELIKNGPKISIFNVIAKGDVSSTNTMRIGLVKDAVLVPLSEVKVLD